MSLDYDLSQIKNRSEVCFVDGYMTVECQNIIFTTMAVGIGQITEANYVEFAVRANMLGGFNVHDDANRNMTPETVMKYVGLRTNVSNETRASWMKRIFEAQMMTANYNERQRLQSQKETVSCE
jgi:hypothetical protein